MQDPARRRFDFKGTILLAAVAIGAGLLLWWAGSDLWHPHALKDRVGGLLQAAGPWAPLVFVLIYALAPFLLVGAIPLTIAGGALFGTAEGAGLSLAGAMLGAAAAFVLGRTLGHDIVSRHAHGKVLSIKAGIEKEGWRFVAFLRLVPILPFGVVNALLGTTDIGFGAFMLTSLVTMIPGSIIYAYVGAAGRAAAAGADDTAQRVGIALGLLALVSGIPAALRYARYRRSRDAISPEPTNRESPSPP